MHYDKAVGRQLAVMPPEVDREALLNRRSRPSNVIFDGPVKRVVEGKAFHILAAVEESVGGLLRTKRKWFTVFSDADADWDKVIDLALNRIGPRAFLFGVDADGVVQTVHVPDYFSRDAGKIDAFIDQMVQRDKEAPVRIRNTRPAGRTSRVIKRPSRQARSSAAERPVSDVEPDKVRGTAAPLDGRKKRRREELPDPSLPANAEVNMRYKQLKYRTFEQVIDAIKEAAEKVDETQSGFINRAVIARLKAEFPDIYEELRSQEAEFPKLREDARIGIDLD